MKRKLCWWILGCWWVLLGIRAQSAAELLAEGERWFQQGEFARANEVYRRMSTNGLPEADVRWILFRRDDSGWRLRDSANLPPAEEAVPELIRFGRLEAPLAQRDRVWAEAQESLGDFHWRRNDQPSWVQSRYEAGLGWWAGQTNLDLARERYLRLARSLELPPDWPSGNRQRGELHLPDAVLANVLTLAQRPADVAAFRLLSALRSARRNAPADAVRTEQEFERALAASVGVEGRDVILKDYAEWRGGRGRWVTRPNGEWRPEPDPEGALKLYRQLLAEFPAGTSRWREWAEARIRELSSPALNLSATGTFLPDSEIVLWLTGRRISSAVVQVRPVDLLKDFKLPTAGQQEWKTLISSSNAVIEEFTVNLAEVESYAWTRKQIILPRRLPVGAYQVEVSGGGVTERELVLVTDLALVVQSDGKSVHTWAVNALTGRPVGEVPVRMVQQSEQWQWVGPAQFTAGNGLVVQPEPEHGGRLLILASWEGRPAFAELWSGWSPPEGKQWEVYAFTDRPAYRPGDEIDWKAIARIRENGVLKTPSQSRLGYRILDPEGTVVTNGVVTLNAYGSAWGQLRLDSQALLGTYQIEFRADGRAEEVVAEEVLFRLEEYRLPEFEVILTPPEERLADGTVRPRRLRAGEPIELQIEARHYFGGGVAGAEAEVVVSRSPYSWMIPRPLASDWMLPPPDDSGRFRGGTSVVERRKIRLDGQGRARFVFSGTQEGVDSTYTFAVAVVDASRREVRAERVLRATVDGYSVRADPSNRLPRPGTPVRVEFRAQDANKQPVATTGQVAVSRRVWWEVWLDSQGREVSGEELKRKRAESPVWPPPVPAGMKEWTLKSSGFQSEALATYPVTIGTNGLGELRFTPEREGYYALNWESPDVWSIVPGRSLTNQIRAEGVFWAVSGATDLGYRSEGIQVLVDRDSVKVGEKVPAMIVAQPGHWIWLTFRADQIVKQQVFQMSGPIQLIELEVTEALVPNFGVQVVGVFNGNSVSEAVQLEVPPVRNFLQVEVRPEPFLNRPGAAGRINVLTRDWEGKPVPAEVALSLVDESVYYIQEDLAGDPRSHFFGRRRQTVVPLATSFDRSRYQRLVLGVNLMSTNSAALELEEGNQYRLELDRVVVTGALLPSAPSLEERGYSSPENAKIDIGDTPTKVRRDFRATAFWRPNVITDATGQASVDLRYPDSTTRWTARAVAVTTGNQVGLGTNSSVTRLPLMVRLQTPRFLTAGDGVVISALLNNTTDQPLTATVILKTSGATVTGLVQDGQMVKGEQGPVVVPAGGEARAEWWVQAAAAGEAVFTVTARAGAESDAMERTVPVVEYGLEQLWARSGKTTNGVTVSLELPAERKGPWDVSVQVAPTLSAALLDALPYLADYPYGCTEQTLSRFLPAVIVRKTLRDLGVDAETVMNRSFGGISTNAAGRVSPHLGGRKDLLKLDDMVSAGLQRLISFQLPSGAWGWWGGGSEDVWMSAYVLWGLRTAEAAGVKLEGVRLGAVEDWLTRQLPGLGNQPDLAAWVLHALSYGNANTDAALKSAQRAALGKTLARRAELSAYSQALLALAAQQMGAGEAAQTLVRGLAASAVREDEPDTSVLYGNAVTGSSTQPTAHWGKTTSGWRWNENSVESTAFVVRAMLAVAPKEPTVEAAVTWLLKNRRGASWSNTRASALTILALTDYMRISQELQADVSYTISVNGRSLGERAMKPTEALSAPVSWSIPEAELKPGRNTVEIRRTRGTAPLYFAVEARYFSQEKPIRPAATELFVRRDYFRLVPVPTLLEGVVDQRVPLRDGDWIRSGDRLECRLIVETKNDLEYVLLEDFKPAGLEAMEVQSGYQLSARALTAAGLRQVQSAPDQELRSEFLTGNEEGLYVEWRDRKAAMFASRMAAGGWEIRVPYRAETPGRFAGLPAVGEAMYAPEVRGNSASQSWEIRDPAK